MACAGKEDIIDEVLYFFKANVLFRNFEVRGPADRLLVYLTLYVTECLKKVEAAPSKPDALRSLTNMALEAFAIPGDASFTLGPYFPLPENRQEAGELALEPATLSTQPARANAQRPFTCRAPTQSPASPCRLRPELLPAAARGDGPASGRKVLPRWRDARAKQVVDIVQQEAVHEQGAVMSVPGYLCRLTSRCTRQPADKITFATPDGCGAPLSAAPTALTSTPPPARRPA